MTINLHIPTKNDTLRPTITVVGVGGAGGNAVNNMIASNLEGVNFVVANTDAQALDNSLTERTIQLGVNITKGLGAGANPEIGRASAEEACDEIASYIEGSNMLFITAGMGGGTGTGAAAVVARIAKEQGMLTVAVVTKPFHFEGPNRMRLAEEGLKELQEYVDTLIVIPNQNLFRIANEKIAFVDALKMADEVLHSGVRGVTDLMVKPGLINLDFADIRTVMREMGKAMMGTGESTGDRRAIEAAEAAISNPLLDDISLKGARALLVNITGGLDMTLFEVDEALNRIREEVDSDANIIFGSTFSDTMEGKMRVSVVATGIDAKEFAIASNQKAANSAPAPVVANDIKKPYSFGAGTPFNAATRPEPIKAPPRGSYGESPRLQTEQRNSVRSEKTAEVENYEYEQVVSSIPNVSSVLRAEASSEVVEREDLMFQHKPAMRVSNAVAASNRQAAEVPAHEREAAPAVRGFFKRMADVGRVFSSSRQEAEQENNEPRVQVVQKPAQNEQSGRVGKMQDEDQYLDIPAFLRRKVN
jgi:cell division protein FtsZ